ncbi:MAG: FKBP-type peptidyl-prolyl cis-trans isomerase [Minisyncoccia bacterium]
MSGKTITAIIVLIIVIIGGVYLFMQYGDSLSGGTEATNTEQTTEQTPPTPQVAGQDAVVGTGAEAAPGSQVSVLYVGMLEDGTVFDSSANNNNEPFVFTLGAPGVVPGFQIGVRGMKEGGERRISIPAELGYGAQEITGPDGAVIIPANSTLVFDIKLVKVEAAPAAAPTE